MMRGVWLIRHGESVSNVDGRTRHPALSQLTAQGWREAKGLVGAFTAVPDLFVLSPFVRAQETAVPTRSHFPDVPVVEWPVYEFTYLSPGRYAGTTGSERAPIAHDYWQRNDPMYKDEGEGESFAELLVRVHLFLAELRQSSAPFTAVFSHGMFLRAVLWVLLTQAQEATPIEMRRYGRFLQAVHMPNAAICRLSLSANTLPLFSGFDTSHLWSALG